MGNSNSVIDELNKTIEKEQKKINKEYEKCDKLLNKFMDEKNINKFSEKSANKFYKKILKPHIITKIVQEKLSNDMESIIIKDFRIEVKFNKWDEFYKFDININENNYISYWYRHYPYTLIGRLDYKNSTEIREDKLKYIVNKLRSKLLEHIRKDFYCEFMSNNKDIYITVKPDENPPPYIDNEIKEYVKIEEKFI